MINDRRIWAAALRANGFTIKEIANVFERSQTTIKVWLCLKRPSSGKSVHKASNVRYKRRLRFRQRMKEAANASP